MDEKERELAPQQVPDDPRPALDEQHNATDAPFVGVVPAVPAGGVTGSAAGSISTGTGGGPGVVPIPIVPPDTDAEDARRES